ncbi:WD40/YVTN/BNR-like repeat-containing protein [Variovorax ureilyticus]|uniref:WD40/YVTN/BNR-like repeat-containing protein n=1 Tax=Variovorax ureilyticus TaxID=1836198 RepID=UPI003D674D1C
MNPKTITRAAALALACAAAWGAQAAADKGWRDVLDTPAARSALASRALLNGLARAGDRIVAVGQRGHIVYSDDAGKTRRRAEVPVSSDLVAVSFPTATDGWAVGHDGVVLRTKDGGQSWTTQLDGRRLGEQGAENPFLDVWFRDADNGYIVGAFGLVFRTADGGAHWEPIQNLVENPKAQHLYAVRGIGPDVYIAGEQGLLLKLAPGDTQFRALELPYKGTLFGVTGSGQTIVAHGLRGTVLRSTDGGRQWQQVPTGLQVGLTASTRDSDGRLLIVSQAGHILASRDDGASFKPVPVAGALPAAAVAVAATGTLVVAGPRGAQSLQLP